MAAEQLPPVAITSSTITTRCPAFKAVCCTSNSSCPYSRSYFTETVFPANFPFLFFLRHKNK